MRSNFIALSLCLLTACGIDDGEPITGCKTDCGPGALRSGRFIPASYGEDGAASPNGKIMARAVGDQIAWLADDFTTTSTTSVGYFGDTEDGRIANLTVTDGGGAYLLFNSDDYSSDLDDQWHSLIAVGTNHEEKWRYDFRDYGEARIIGDDDLALVTGALVDIAGHRLTRNTIVALHSEDGAIAWAKDLAWEVDDIKKVSGGDVIITGRSAQDRFVAALDPATGESKWVTPIMGDSVIWDLAVDAAGDVAIRVDWYSGSVSVGDHTLSGSDELNFGIATLEPTGNVRWFQKTDRVPQRLAVDGDRVVATDAGYIMQFSSAGVDWTRDVTGAGTHLVHPVALTADRFVVSILADENQAGAPTTTVGDVTIAGEGLILANVVH